MAGKKEERMMPLGEVAHIVMGLSPKGDTYNHDGRGEPLLNGPTEFGPSHPIPVLFTTSPSRFAEPGDVLFCVRGSTTGSVFPSLSTGPGPNAGRKGTFDHKLTSDDAPG